jgi:hypothetical protein
MLTHWAAQYGISEDIIYTAKQELTLIYDASKLQLRHCLGNTKIIWWKTTHSSGQEAIMPKMLFCATILVHDVVRKNEFPGKIARINKRWGKYGNNDV